MQDFQQRRNDLISPQIRQAFDRPVADVDVGIVNRTEQYPCGPLLLNAAIAKQSNVPKSVGPRSLLSGFGIRLQAIYRGGNTLWLSRQTQESRDLLPGRMRRIRFQEHGRRYQ